MHGDPWTSYAYLRDYNPYWLPGRVPNPAFRRPEDALVLDLKEGFENGIDHARHEFLAVSLELELPDETLVAIVPGHAAAPSNAERPLAKVVGRLVNWNGSLTAAVDCLIRLVDIPKLATGGNRDADTHLGSIRLGEPETVHDATVLLLDDVATTGHSLLACREILLRGGARRVAAVALARTVPRMSPLR